MKRRVVCLTGLDGSGKSTQSKLLRQRLCQQGLRVVQVHQYEPVTAWGKLLKRSMRVLADAVQARIARPGTVLAARAPRDGKARNKRRRILPTLLAIWWLVGGWWRARANLVLHRTCDVLVFDRCYVDELLRVAWKLDKQSLFGFVLMRSLPVPDLVLELQADEEDAWRRKKSLNTTREQHAHKREILKTIMDTVRGGWPVCVLRVRHRSEREVADDLYEEVQRLFES